MAEVEHLKLRVAVIAAGALTNEISRGLRLALLHIDVETDLG
jgi:hypothetical protein